MGDMRYEAACAQIWGVSGTSGSRWVWVGITARKRHTFRVNKSSESRIALTYNILEGLGGVGVHARGAGHAPARACGCVLAPRSVLKFCVK